jgi:molybdate transport system ATP-binding protein
VNLIIGNFQDQMRNFSLEASFSVPANGLTGLCGRSGSGKSTFLRAIAGLHKANGKLSVQDAIWQDDAAGIFVPTHLRRVGLVSQSPFLFPHLNVRKNLEFGFQLLKESEKKIAFIDIVHHFDLEKLLERSPQKLSGGETQRVATARTLLTSPKLILLDEPLSGLDQESKSEIMPYLKKLRALQIPGFYVSHDLDEIRELTERVFRMKDGVLIQNANQI